MALSILAPIAVRTAILLGLSLTGLGVAAAAKDAPDAPAPSVSVATQTPPAALSDIYRVSATRTPSGFDVPRFVSLKFGKVNARTGPSRNHPIAYQYQRRGLPLVVVAETEMWRKVRDIQGDEAWVRKPALSGDRFAITLSDLPLQSRPDADARTVARVERGALVHLGECNADGFCRVRTENGVKGWSRRHDLWGAQSID